MPHHDPQTLIPHLQAIPYFAGLEPALLLEIAQAAIWREYAAGAMVFLEGEFSLNLYYLAFGWIKVVKMSAEGREQVLRFLGPGDVFNEVGVFVSRPNPATAIALEHCGVWLLQRQQVRRVLEAHPAMLLQVLENMARRIAYLAEMVAELSLHTVEARLARLLLDQAQGGVVQRQRWNTQAEMAARLGTVPDVLSRALRSLSDAGLIAVDRQQFRILDARGLSERALLKE
ncbi:MAG: Crp/Fnr family transcriptional regulator [Caldilineales bacterium]|nr:Crp/Fnr family transcriptional regulator [Caldilineales bacterium]